MNQFKYMAGVAIAAMAISSCEDGVLDVGNSLTSNNDRLNVTSGVCLATTRTIVADSVLALTSNCYLGRVVDPETKSNAEVKSEFSTQFHVLEGFSLPAEENIVDTTSDGRASAVSCDLILYLSSPFNAEDTTASMKMQVQEMLTPVEQGKTYYTNFDLQKEGMIRQDGINRSKVFTYYNLTDGYEQRTSTDYLENVRITLNDPYTDKQGKTYNNYGTYLMHQYYDHPEFYRNSYTFAHNICPGFFFHITDGFGFYTKIAYMGLRVFYNENRTDSIAHTSFVLAGTSEVKQTNLITNDAKAMQDLAAEQDYTYLKTPAGLFTEVTLPVEDIKNGHEKDSLLSAHIVFQRQNYNSEDSRKLGIPSTLLMVQKDSLTSFFENLKVPDSKKSYMTAFASAYNAYSFSNISNLINALWHEKKAGEASDPNWTANHPDWNKVVLVPVTYTTASSSSTVPIRVEHDMSLTSTRLVGGANHPIEVGVIYAKFE